MASNLLRNILIAGASLVSVAVLSLKPAEAVLGFNLNNQTGLTIRDIYVSPYNSDIWGADRLPSAYLQTGYKKAILYPYIANTCSFDMKVVFTNGSSYVREKLDLCSLVDYTLY